MRILQIVPRYAPAWAFGGGVRMTFELARQWVKHGHQVTVFTSDQIDSRHRSTNLHDVMDGIHIHRFKNPHNFLAARYAFLFLYPMGLARALQSCADQFDVAHLAEARGRHNDWAARFLPQQNVPFVWSGYGGLADGEGLRRIYRQVHDCVFNTASIVQRAGGLIAQTAHEASVYSQFGARPDQIREIPLGVNWNDFESLPPRGQLRHRIGLSDKDKLILFVGRVHWTKGLQLLIPAFAEVARRMPQAYLVIVGWDHGFLNRAKQITTELHLSDRVFFLEPLFGSERLSAYVDADVFALTPCVYEETSLSALEACACGTSCVVTKQCEIPGLDENTAGLTVDYNLEQVANALWQSLQQGFSERCGANARRLVQERFTITAIAKEHERFFEDVANAK